MVSSHGTHLYRELSSHVIKEAFQGQELALALSGLDVIREVCPVD